MHKSNELISGAWLSPLSNTRGYGVKKFIKAEEIKNQTGD
jgi:hypothetical protein